MAKNRSGGRIGQSTGTDGLWATVPCYYLFPKDGCRGGCRTRLANGLKKR